MNNIDYLVSVIKRNIPNEILTMVFIDFIKINTLRTNLDYYIKQKVIYDWVVKDCNLVGGIETVIDITTTRRENVDGGILIYVGFGPTAGKNIMSVLSIGYGYTSYFGNQPGIVSALTEPLQVSDSRIELVGDNIIFVEGYVGINITNLRCVLENDKDFNNISPRSLPKLSELTLLAAKAYIFNAARIKLGNATIINGIDMPQIIEIVSSYSDSYEQYHEMLINQWTKINMLNDKVSRNRLIKMIIPS